MNYNINEIKKKKKKTRKEKIYYSATAAPALEFVNSVETRKVERLIVIFVLQFVHLIAACSLSPETPRTSPKNTLFSTPQLGHGPRATEGFLNRNSSVMDFVAVYIG